MQEGDPQIHFSGNAPVAGNPALKSMVVKPFDPLFSGGAGNATSDSVVSKGNTADAIGAVRIGVARKDLRFIGFILSSFKTVWER
jgi:hypothetical protein